MPQASGIPMKNRSNLIRHKYTASHRSRMRFVTELRECSSHAKKRFQIKTSSQRLFNACLVWALFQWDESRIDSFNGKHGNYRQPKIWRKMIHKRSAFASKMCIFWGFTMAICEFEYSTHSLCSSHQSRQDVLRNF